MDIFRGYLRGGRKCQKKYNSSQHTKKILNFLSTRLNKVILTDWIKSFTLSVRGEMKLIVPFCPVFFREFVRDFGAFPPLLFLCRIIFFHNWRSFLQPLVSSSKTKSPLEITLELKRLRLHFPRQESSHFLCFYFIFKPPFFGVISFQPDDITGRRNCLSLFFLSHLPGPEKRKKQNPVCWENQSATKSSPRWSKLDLPLASCVLFLILQSPQKKNISTSAQLTKGNIQSKYSINYQNTKRKTDQQMPVILEGFFSPFGFNTFQSDCFLPSIFSRQQRFVLFLSVFRVLL